MKLFINYRTPIFLIIVTESTRCSADCLYVWQLVCVAMWTIHTHSHTGLNSTQIVFDRKLSVSSHVWLRSSSLWTLEEETLESKNMKYWCHHFLLSFTLLSITISRTQQGGQGEVTRVVFWRILVLWCHTLFWILYLLFSIAALQINELKILAINHVNTLFLKTWQCFRELRTGSES